MTVSEIYPHYYPKGAVEYFLAHHNEANIIKDIKENQVFLCFDLKRNVVGTVTIRENEICRLFVLPSRQGNGYGTELLDHAEKIISHQYSKIILSSSLPAKNIYQKRGYKDTGFNIIPTDHGDFLCYDVMVKQV